MARTPSWAGRWVPARLPGVSSAGRYESDGFRRNSFLRRDDTNGYSESSARLKLSAQPTEDLRVKITALWSDLDNGYDAFSIDNSRVTLSDKPGQDTQISRALSMRLDYDGAEAFDVDKPYHRRQVAQRLFLRW